MASMFDLITCDMETGKVVKDMGVVVVTNMLINSVPLNLRVR